MPDFIQTLSKLFQRQAWIDGAAKPLQKAVNQVLENGSPVSDRAADLLNGTWLGHPIHPVLTDIPVGAWMAAVTLDTMEASTGRPGIGRAADTAVALGVAGAVGSAVTGLADWQHTTGETRRIGMVHALLNTVALGLFVASMFARGKHNRSLGRNLALSGLGIASASAYLGGDLVFRQKMGVNHAPKDDEIQVQDFVPVLPVDQLPENTLTIALLNTTPLVLLRRGETVYALAETCAHLGGPLADGDLRTGPDGQPAVSCPWHGSTFDMDNGTVLHGPSAYPQPCFEARISNGQVEVRNRSLQRQAERQAAQPERSYA
jgi:nitrite reductase/ring-hydroxylating ferredoxin subunit/uncharacterized membrane protein